MIVVVEEQRLWWRNRDDWSGASCYFLHEIFPAVLIGLCINILFRTYL